MADISKIKTLDGTTYDIKDTIARMWSNNYGVCEASADTQLKQATCSKEIELVNGVSVNILFINSNTVLTPRLSVNNSTYYPIKRSLDNEASTSISTSWKPGAIVSLIFYDGEWIMQNELSTSVRLFSGSMIGSVMTDTSGTIVQRMSNINKYMGLTDKIVCLPMTSYTVQYNNIAYDRPHCYITQYDINGMYLTKDDIGNVSYDNSITFTTLPATYYFHIYYYKSPGADIDETTCIKIEADISDAITTINSLIINLTHRIISLETT